MMRADAELTWPRCGRGGAGSDHVERARSSSGRWSAAGPQQGPAADSGRQARRPGGEGHDARAYISDCITYSGLRETDPPTSAPPALGQAVLGLVRSPLMPPSTASAVPVVAPASGLAR